MLSTLSIAASLLALLPSALAANVVSMSVSRVAPPTLSQLTRRGIVPRASTISETLVNNATGGAYQATVKVGTPGQQIILVLDTGSSDVYVLSYEADQCTEPEVQAYYSGGCFGGTYNPTKSSTYKLLEGAFEIEYADNTGSSGEYISDVFSIGGSSISGLQMGYALNTTVGVGIMGIGYDTNEAAKTPYPNLIDQLVSQSLINIKAYSLYLDDLEASTGSILFGGIDSAKYIGELIGLPVQKDAESGTYSSFTVAMTSLTAVEGSNTTTLTNSTFAEPVILDSGTTLTYLPDDLVASIVSYLGGYDDTQSGNIYVDCTLRTTKSDLSFEYGFGGSSGPTVKVPISELFFDVEAVYSEDSSSSGSGDSGGGSGGDSGSGSGFGGGSSGGTGTSSSGLPFASTCVLGIAGSGDGGTNLLGDTFLRSAYVVYDLTNNEIAMAQTNYNATTSSITEIAASATGIPNVSGVASQVTVQQTATGVPGVGVISGTATGAAATVTVTSGTTSTSKGAATGAVPAFDVSQFAVLCISGVFAIAGGSWFLA